MIHLEGAPPICLERLKTGGGVVGEKARRETDIREERGDGMMICKKRKEYI